MSEFDPTRREVLGGMAASAAVTSIGCGPGSPAPNSPKLKSEESPLDFELAEQSITALGALMSSGKRSSEQLVGLYLERIAQLNTSGPELRAVIELNPDASAIAQAADSERAANLVRGPLHGIPILLKDNIATADKMENTAGSLALVGHKPTADSTVAARLREAGAVILGKANLSEWANMRSTKSTSGWSARGGTCRSPYVLDRNPCGSSSGSGVAAAANLCAAAVGTETDGSIVCPSSHNNLVGIKPTVGLVSRAGIIPISVTQDTAGPMARTVADATHLLAVMIGADARDPASTFAHSITAKTLTDALRPGGLKGARIGIARNLFGFHAGVDAIIEDALKVIGAAGAVLVDDVSLPKNDAFSELEFEILLTELKATMADYLSQLPDGAPKTLADLIAFNVANTETELVHFGQELFELAEAKGPLDENYRAKLAELRRQARDEGIDKAIAKDQLDAIVAPTNAPAWTTDFKNGDSYIGGSSSPAAVAGYANITVPAGFIGELPIGVSLIGPAWSEPTLIRLAFDFESRAGARRRPRFVASQPD